MENIKFETWIIDHDIWRRGNVSSHFIHRGYLTIPMDPMGPIDLIKDINEIYIKHVLAMIHEGSEVIDRILDCQNKRAISCLVYSDSLTAKPVGNLLLESVGPLVDWPCPVEEVASAVAAQAGGSLALRGDASPCA